MTARPRHDAGAKPEPDHGPPQAAKLDPVAVPAPGRTPAPTVTPARVTSVGAPADANAGAGSLLERPLSKAPTGRHQQ